MRTSVRYASGAVALMISVFAVYSMAASAANSGNETVTKITGKDVSAYTAAQLNADMGIGVWEGDSFDKTQAAALKKRGVSTVRIEGDWTGHISTDGKYTVDADWLTGIKKTVDAAVSQDMYTVLSFDSDEKNAAEQKAVWQQLTESFSEYDRKLIFAGDFVDMKADISSESMTESKTDSKTESGADADSSGSGTKETTAPKSVVKTIRAAKGGAKRVLLIDETDWYSVETDVNMMVAVSSAGFAVKGDKFTDEDADKLELQFGRLELSWLDSGVPVVIDNAAVSSFVKNEENVKWAECFAKGAKQLGVPAVFGKLGSKDDKATSALLDTYSQGTTTGTVIVTEEAEKGTKIADSGTIVLKAGTDGSYTASISISGLLGDIDVSKVKAIRLTGADGFHIGKEKGSDKVKQLIYPDKVKGDNVVITSSAASGTRKIYYEILTADDSLKPYTKYLQFTPLDGSGKCYARAVMMVKREEAESASEVKFTFEVYGQKAEIVSEKYYDAVSVQGDTIKPDGGYVFVAAVISGVPDDAAKTLSIRDIELISAEDDGEAEGGQQ